MNQPHAGDLWEVAPPGEHGSAEGDRLARFQAPTHLVKANGDQGAEKHEARD